MWVREFVCVVGAILLVPALGFACNIPNCAEEFELSAEGSTIPANTTALMIDVFGADPQGAIVELETSAGESVSISVESDSNWWKIDVTDGLEVNESYTLRIGRLEGPGDLSVCGESPPEFQFDTGGEVAFPTGLGELSASESAQDSVEIENGASCSEFIDSTYVDVELAFPDEVAAWRGSLIIETFVNDAPWKKSSFYGSKYKPGESWVGFAKDRVFTLCDPIFKDTGLQSIQEGTVEVQMRAYIPGTQVALESNSIQVELRCESDETILEPNLEGDMGSEPDLQNGMPAAESEGCGCASTQGGGWLAAGLGLFMIRRRKRKSSNQQELT